MEEKTAPKKGKMKKCRNGYVRSDGWFVSKDGMNRLRDGGKKGHDGFMKSVESEIGKWHRVSMPLDSDAAIILSGIKGMVPRAKFLSSAITRYERERLGSVSEGIVKSNKTAKFMRLTLTEEANAVVKDMNRAEFRAFVSSAIVSAVAAGL